MRYTIDDLQLDTAEAALIDNQYGLERASDDRGVCYVTIWTDNNIGESGDIGGFAVGCLARNPGGIAPTYMLVMDEHLNAKERIAAVITNVLRRKTMR